MRKISILAIAAVLIPSLILCQVSFNPKSYITDIPQSPEDKMFLDFINNFKK